MTAPPTLPLTENHNPFYSLLIHSSYKASITCIGPPKQDASPHKTQTCSSQTLNSPPHTLHASSHCDFRLLTQDSASSHKIPPPHTRFDPPHIRNSFSHAVVWLLTELADRLTPFVHFGVPYISGGSTYLNPVYSRKPMTSLIYNLEELSNLPFSGLQTTPFLQNLQIPAEVFATGSTSQMTSGSKTRRQNDLKAENRSSF